MPDHELVQLIQNSMMHISEMAQGMLVGIFAFLTACYFVARHLNWFAFVTLVVLYIFYSYTYLSGMYYSLSNLTVFISEAASRPSLSIEMELYTQDNVTASFRALPVNLGLYCLAIIISVLFGALLKAGKLRVQ